MEKLVSSTVTPYLSTSGLTENMTNQTGNSSSSNEATEQHQVKSYFTGSERLHPVMEDDSSSHSQQSSASSFTTVTTIGTSSSQWKNKSHEKNYFTNDSVLLYKISLRLYILYINILK